MRVVDIDNLSFHCNYEGDCTADKSACEECANYVIDYRDVEQELESEKGTCLNRVVKFLCEACNSL